MAMRQGLGSTIMATNYSSTYSQGWLCHQACMLGHINITSRRDRIC